MVPMWDVRSSCTFNKDKAMLGLSKMLRLVWNCVFDLHYHKQQEKCHVIITRVGKLNNILFLFFLFYVCLPTSTSIVQFCLFLDYGCLTCEVWMIRTQRTILTMSATTHVLGTAVRVWMRSSYRFLSKSFQIPAIIPTSTPPDSLQAQIKDLTKRHSPLPLFSPQQFTGGKHKSHLLVCFQ